MPRKKKPEIFVDGHGDVREVVEWPKIIKGSHSTRIEHEDGRVEFYTDWEALQRDVQNALTEYENSVKVIKSKTSKAKKSKNET